MSVEQETRQEMNQSVEHLLDELKNIRTGRANPGLVEGVLVEVYGSSMRLADLANITAPESQQLLISPYDANNAAIIGKAIERANLGMQCITEGNIVRLIVPPMDESIRQQMAKECRKRAEDAKISIRNTRRKYNDRVREMKSAGEIAEDVMNREEKVIQKLTDDFCTKIDELSKKKEQEITSI